jgi:uncharacterized protein (UPF0264 family)
MTGLLVSVRSVAEAEIALRAGADLIDVKEPSRGSLGAADPAVWRHVCRVVAGRVPVSVALGELAVQEPGSAAADLSSSGVAFAKIGLAGMRDKRGWPDEWRRSMSRLPREIEPVAVAYADWQTAGAPAPHEVLAAAARLSSPYLLVDTCDKSRGNLLAHLSLEELQALSARAAEKQIRLVLAGSLDEAAIARLLALAPAYIAVRGAACEGERTQAICEARVKRLATLVRTSIAPRSDSLLDTGLGSRILPACGGEELVTG